MKKIKTLMLSIALFVMGFVPSFAQENERESEALKNWTPPDKYVIDTRIDNMAYWSRLAELGLVPVAPQSPYNVTTYTGNEIYSPYVMTTKSTDVPTTTVNSTQSENSIVVDPLNDSKIMNSNNSTQNPVGNLYGANYLYSTDGGTLWGGSVNGAGGTNSGDPTTGIDRNGRYYIGFINNASGQSVSWSTNQGTTWTPVVTGIASSSMLDKNHMWVDISATSPYVNNIYDAWTNFGATGSPIEFTRSTNGGLNWSTQTSINTGVNAGSHNQGVNITTGPNGQVYVFWTVYDSWPSVEGAYAFAKSTNGGATFSPATKFLTGTKGIRSTGALFHNIRTNSFPSACCDISGGTNNGAIYMIWPNNGVPGINTGTDIDVYLVKSTNEGTSWSAPIRVTNDPLGNGKKVANPWITCDPVSGALSVVFYDDRNCSASQSETWVANSVDGGLTWDNFKVSDVAFTPTPIPGLAGGYMGDYLGITARAGKVYPCWSDNRSGAQLTYVSPYTTGPPPGQPFVTYNAFTLNDPAPNGNNNHQMDYAENNTFTLAVKNIGDQTSNNVVVKLRTTCPYITLTDSTESYGDITAGTIVSKTDAYAYTVANNIPDGTPVSFMVIATDISDRTYVSNFIVEAHAPALSILGYTINDAVGGNNNGMLDAGESADIIFSVSNPGDWDVTNVTSTLSITDPNVTVTIPTVDLTTMTSGQTKQATHHVTVASGTPIGSSINMNYSVSGNSGNYVAQKTFIAKVGLIIEDWETNNFLKYLWIQDTPTYPWTITNVNPYEQVYCAKSGAISNYGSTSISISRSCADDSISFYKKVSSEPTYDFLKFYIDGTMIDSWSGEVAWSRAAYPVTQGTHIFKWEYMKDVSQIGGDDCALIDYIVFPAPPADVVKEIPTVNNNIKINCYPNPVNGLATVVYNIDKPTEVSIKIYNNLGKEVASLLNHQITYAGTHQSILNSKGLPSGMYFVVLTADGKSSSIKIVVN